MAGMSQYLTDSILSFLFRTQATPLNMSGWYPGRTFLALCTADPGACSSISDKPIAVTNELPLDYGYERSPVWPVYARPWTFESTGAPSQDVPINGIDAYDLGGANNPGDCDVWVADVAHIYCSRGNTGTHVRGAWQQVGSFASEGVAIHASKVSTHPHAFAVGAGGEVLHSVDYGAFATEAGGLTTIDLFDVYCRADLSDGMVVGDGGDTLRWNGSTWSKITSAASRLARVHGVPPHFYATDITNLVVYHFNGTSWSSIGGPAGIATLDDIYAVSTSEVWVLASASGSPQRPMIFKWNGSTWSEILRLPQSNDAVGFVRRFKFQAADNIWVVGGNGIVHYNGTSWVKCSGALPPSGGNWRPITSKNPIDPIWVGSQGPAGEVGHWNGDATEQALANNGDGRKATGSFDVAVPTRGATASANWSQVTHFALVTELVDLAGTSPLKEFVSMTGALGSPITVQAGQRLVISVPNFTATLD